MIDDKFEQLVQFLYEFKKDEEDGILNEFTHKEIIREIICEAESIRAYDLMKNHPEKYKDLNK